jgi:eukaryotic-like serine/threonine-protein kinase
MATGSSLTGLRQLGKYTISEVLGKGAMGLVYKGFDPHVRRAVALKTIRKRLADGDRGAALLARFRSEAHAAGRLSHPGNVAVYEWGEAGELAYLAMEYVQGVSLREHFDGGRRFSLDDIVNIMVQLLDALHDAHEQGVWHRDIEPANIIIMGDGKLKVADFGIERNGSSVPARVYMAPERHDGGPVDLRAEIFSAGVVLYQLLTGRHPFNGDTEAIARKICHEAPLPPSRIDPERCAARFDAVVKKALSRKAAERYQNARAFRDELLAAHAAPVGPAVAEETTGTAIPPPVPDEPFHSAKPPQSSAPEPSRPTPSQPSETHAALARYESSGPAEPSLPPHPAPAEPSGWFPEPEHHQTHQASETPQPSYPAPPPRWDETVLRQIERQLARLVGPIATLMVKRAAAGTTDVDTLYRVLAGQLTDKAERAVFLYGRNRLQGVPPRETNTAAGPRTAGMPFQPWGTTASRLKPSQPPWSHTDHAQPDLSAITAPGWDTAILKQVERQLARIVGPVAKLMVRRAAAITTDLDELYGVLAEKLTERDLRTVLLYGWWNRTLEFRPRRTDAASGLHTDDQVRATGASVQPTPGASAIWPPGWDPAVLTQVERQLVRFVGPVARLLVRRGAAGTMDIDELYGVLAEKLTAGQERAAFLDGRNRLQGIPPREVDESGTADRANHSDHAGLPAANGEAGSETPPSPSATHEETHSPPGRP